MPHSPTWCTQGSCSLLKQKQCSRHHSYQGLPSPGPQSDPDPSTQTSEAESDSFIKRLLKERAGYAEGKDNPRWSGWNKQLASETSLRVGSEVPQAQVGLRVEQIGQRELRTSESPWPLPSFTTPLHRGGQQQVERVLQARLV